MSRIAKIGSVLELDLGPARAELDKFVREATSKGINVPVSSNFSGSGAPATTLGGANLGTFSVPSAGTGVGSTSITAMISQQTQAIVGAITSALKGPGQAYNPGYPISGGPSSGPLAENLARTRGTYRDPGADLNAAIREAADVEALSYPTSGMSPVPGDAAAPGPRGRGGRYGGQFGRIISQVAGGYAVYHAAHAGLQYANNRLMESVYSDFGDQDALLSSQQSTYQGVVSSFGPLGSLYDFAANLAGSGSVGIERDKLEVQRGRQSEQSNLRNLDQQRRGRSALFDSRTAIGESGIRNWFDLEAFGAGTDYARTVFEGDQEASRRRDDIASTRDPFTAGLKGVELDFFNRSQEVVNSAAGDTLKARRRRIGEDREFFQQGQDIGFSTSLAQNAAIAANNPLGARLAGIYGQTRGAITSAVSEDRSQDIGKLVSVGISEAAKELATTARSNALSNIGLQGSIGATNLLIDHKPLDAQLLEIETRRKLQQAQLPTGSLFDLLGGSALRTGIDQQASADSALARQRRAQENQSLDNNLDSRAAQQDALNRRDPIGAQIAGIVGRTRDEAMSLAFSDHPEQAIKAAQLGAGQINLLGQEFGQSFHATARPQDFITDNPRQATDIATILKEIAEGQKELNDNLVRALQDLASD